MKSKDVTNKNEINESDVYQMDRRTFLKATGVAVGAIAFGSGLSRLIEPAMAAVNLTKFVDPLPIPPVATAGTNISYLGADYYEISILKATHKFHRDLAPAPTYSYGADYLGPTIVAKKGKEVVIKFTNNLLTGNHLLHNAIDTTIMGASPNDAHWMPGDPIPPYWIDENRVAVHLHGGKVKPEFDGHPRAWFSPVGSTQSNPYPEKVDPSLTGSYIYEYPNDQPAATLWYHDHAWGITRFNPFAGLAAAYLLRDTFMNDLINGTNNGGYNAALQKIPSGNYEVPIVLQDKLFNTANGSMIYPNVGVTPYHPLWIPEYFGDTPVVNGKAYPFLDVEPRRYLFHFLNGSNARFYNVWFDNGLAPVPFWVIGSEQGFLSAPAMLTKLLIAPGERFDVIFDFTGMPNGTILTLKNNAKAPYPGGRGGLPQIMQFRVNKPLAAGGDSTTLANALTLPPIASVTIPNTPWREIVLQEKIDPATKNPIEVLLDGYHFIDSINDDTLFTAKAGKTVVWQFINLTADAHPMHTHLVPFKVKDRQPFDVAGFTAAWDAWIKGNRSGTRPTIDTFLTKGPAVLPPEETGWKDTAKAYPGEVLRIVAKFDLPTGITSGKYVCHCHILEHEENDMMFQFVVSP